MAIQFQNKKNGISTEVYGNSDSTSISIFSFSTQQYMTFPAFITQFNDSYKSEWTTTPIYGRMDPIATFKNTTRKISLGFDVPSYNIEEAAVNNAALDVLIQSLYPVYIKDGEGAKGASIMGTPPLFSIGFANLISEGGGDILCYLDGFEYAPDLEAGFFTTTIEKYDSEKNKFEQKPRSGHIFPKLFKVSLNINVIHKKPLGREFKDNISTSRAGLIEYNHFLKPPNLVAVKELSKGTNFIEFRDKPDGRYGDAVPKNDIQNKNQTVK